MLSRELIRCLSRKLATPAFHLTFGCRTEPSFRNCQLISSRRWATSVTPHSNISDPTEAEAIRWMEKGAAKYGVGDVQGAKELWKRSLEIKKTAELLFKLGLTHYHLKEYDDAISAWKESIAFEPWSSNPHMYLANAYIESPVPRPDLALHHLYMAYLHAMDSESAFNYAAVLEATGQLVQALEMYKRSKEHGFEQTAIHIRNVSAKIQKIRQQENADISTTGSNDNTT